MYKKQIQIKENFLEKNSRSVDSGIVKTCDELDLRWVTAPAWPRGRRLAW